MRQALVSSINRRRDLGSRPVEVARILVWLFGVSEVMSWDGHLGKHSAPSNERVRSQLAEAWSKWVSATAAAHLIRHIGWPAATVNPQSLRATMRLDDDFE
jgi:hypothetical protein